MLFRADSALSQGDICKGKAHYALPANSLEGVSWLNIRQCNKSELQLVTASEMTGLTGKLTVQIVIFELSIGLLLVVERRKHI
tara:strand:- start:1903 stop:2151 length:249 start_codon:yes stop_codon:yes gene_type:complete